MRLLADEDLNKTIVEGVRRLLPSSDFVRLQDLGFAGSKDDFVLTFATQQNRVLVSQ
jgi:predicted nuclease of predicted toxin-antitoxin system